jgi:putative peptidoglycan binding protein/CHAP domain-containing protein
MSTVDHVLDRARSQIGVKEHPAGSNRTPYCDWYGITGPWCAMFVSWCTYMEGLPLSATTAKGFAYTPSGVAWFQRRRRWTTRPAPGHIVFFDFPGDSVKRVSHVGIVESVRPDGSIVTIEGNTDERGGRTGGRVMRKVRRVGIVGYGVPDYQDGRRDDRPVALRFPGRLLKQGVRGPDVKLVQGRLVQLGVARLAVDGGFGPLTEAAVRKFQRAKGLEVDGVVGPRTWKALWSS